MTIDRDHRRIARETAAAVHGLPLDDAARVIEMQLDGAYIAGDVRRLLWPAGDPYEGRDSSLLTPPTEDC